MNSAAPEGTPPRRSDDRNKIYFIIYLPRRTELFYLMTERPIFSESRRRPVGAAVSLTFVFVSTLLMTGCVDQLVLKKLINEFGSMKK